MNNDIKELMSGILKDMSALNYIKPGDVPNINLYMDQVTTFMYIFTIQSVPLMIKY
jgi:hypothetical protein